METNGGKLTQQEILTLIDALRAKGVTYFKSADVELTLGPAPDIDKPVEPEQVRGEARLGRDGLTAEEQVELYGRVMDAKG